MIPDLNFGPSDEANYTAEEPSGSNFLQEYFQTMIKIFFIQIRFKI
jgi:hypothetical protein